jgi:hypothetical protein
MIFACMHKYLFATRRTQRSKTGTYPVLPIAIFLLLSSHLFAGFSLTKKNLQAYDQLLNLDVDKAKKLLCESEKEDPDNLLNLFFENHIDFVQLMASKDPALFEKLKENEDIRIDKIKSSGDKNSPYFLYVQAEISLEWAASKLVFDENISAAFDIRKAYVLIKENQKKFPDFILNNKIDGILNVTIGSIPDGYAWIANLFGLYGSKPVGMKQLKLLTDADTPFKTEASILFYMVQDYVMSEENSSITELERMYSQKNSPLIISLAYADLLMKDHQSETAKKVLLNAAAALPVSVPLVYKMLADTYFFKGEYATARGFYYKFLTTNKGGRLLKDVYFKLYIGYWLDGNSEQAAYCVERIKKDGTAEL